LATGKWECGQRLDNKSRMNREVHVRFREGVGVKFPRATRLNDSGFWLSKEKDNFHTPSYSIDKTTIFDMVNSTIPIEFSLSKGGG